MRLNCINLFLSIILSLYIQISLIASTPLTSKEFGFFIGESYYLGELNNIHFIPFNPAVGIFHRYNYDDRIGIKTQFTYGKITGNGSNSVVPLNLNNNANFINQLFELSAVGEFNFLPFSHLSPKGKKITPFVFLGLGLFYQNHSKTFAEGVKYKSLQAAIPLGVGLKYASGKFGVSLDWGIRKTFTDYLDDISSYHPSTDRNYANIQRGEVFNKDWYTFTGISLFINLTKKRSCPN